MEGFLTQLVGEKIYVFLLVFARIGTALMILPGIGDSFVPERVRLLFCLSFAVILTPIVSASLPVLNVGTSGFIFLLASEMLIGLLIGTIARVMMTALDTAGMLISVNTGLSAAQIFNPAFATQGSIFGGFLSVAGVLLLLVTDLHHMLLQGLLSSYKAFPPAELAFDSAMAADAVGKAVNEAFLIGFQMAIPLTIVMLVVAVCMGVLSRLMPQLQIFSLALPLQILGGFALLSITIGGSLLFWLRGFEGNLLQLTGQ